MSASNTAVAAAAALNVKPSTNKSVDIPKARQDIKSLLEQAKEGLKQATAYPVLSMTSHEPTLEEAFLEYYRDGK